MAETCEFLYKEGRNYLCDSRLTCEHKEPSEEHTVCGYVEKLERMLGNSKPMSPKLARENQERWATEQRRMYLKQQDPSRTAFP